MHSTSGVDERKVMKVSTLLYTSTLMLAAASSSSSSSEHRTRYSTFGFSGHWKRRRETAGTLLWLLYTSTLMLAAARSSSSSEHSIV
jgi:hypothetical protein